MEWTTIDHNGTMLMAKDFLNGVLVDINTQILFVPGYYVQEELGDMDGPALRPRKKRPQVFGIELREIGR
jgi:hypothetical protein